MKFNRKPKKIDKKEQATQNSIASLEYLYRSIINFEGIDAYSIKLLALELRKLLTDKKEIDGKYISIFDYVFENPKFPEIFSIEDRILSNQMFNNNAEEEIGLDKDIIKRGINFASSMASFDGVYKPVIKPNKFVSSKEWLSTNVLVLSNEDSNANFISIENIIKDIGNKESAHLDIEFITKKNQRYNLLERLDERYEIIIGFVEVILALYDSLTKNVRFSMISLTDKKTEGVVRYKQYIKDSPIRMDYFISFNNETVYGGALLSYSLLRPIKTNENVSIFGYGDDFSVCINENNQLYINSKGQKFLF